MNRDKEHLEIKMGDIVKAHIQVQSNSSKGEVKKLRYQARGHFCIIKILDGNLFEVQNWTDTTAKARKYKAIEIYLLPPYFSPLNL